METNEVISGGYNSLSGYNKMLKVSKKFNSLTDPMYQVLTEFGYEELDEIVMNPLLLVQGKIPTIYREPSEYRVLDTIFYWED